MDKPTRSHETEIEISATPAEIWEAITEAEGIARWFAPEAKTETGVGGKVWISWGGGMEFTSTIAKWDPEKHLRWESSARAPKSDPTAMAQLATDFYIEAKAGGTAVLRLVQSGFGMEASWDGEFDGTKHGWAVFFRILKHALERHKGKKSYQANLYEPLIGDATKQSAWTNLSTRFAGSIDSAHEPDDVVVISQVWNEALIWFTTTKKFVSASFVTYGMELDRFEAAKLELEATMKQAAGHSA